MAPASTTRLARRLRARWGLRRIAAHELLEEATARRLTGPLRRLAVARARRRVPALRRWAGIPERTFARNAHGGNAVRIARVRDLVPAGSRILDVGAGHGYVAGVLLRDRAPASYCGVELRQARTDAVREMLAANQLDGARIELVTGDVLDAGPSFWRDRDPDAVLLLEVLEHLADPGAVLGQIAASARAGARILFTVPLRGRLESVWGHRSLFDSRRLDRLCRDAGLAIERAEPVQSTWALILARSGAGEVGSTSSPDPAYTFKRVQPDDGGGGAIALPIAAPGVVRLEIALEPPRACTLRIRALDASGGGVLEWAGPAVTAPRATYVLRPGKGACSLQPLRRGNPLAVRSVEVAVEVESGQLPGVRVRRAAYAAAR